jgi:hypothetical protein
MKAVGAPIGSQIKAILVRKRVLFHSKSFYTKANKYFNTQVKGK